MDVPCTSTERTDFAREAMAKAHFVRLLPSIFMAPDGYIVDVTGADHFCVSAVDGAGTEIISAGSDSIGWSISISPRHPRKAPYPLVSPFHEYDYDTGEWSVPFAPMPTLAAG